MLLCTGFVVAVAFGTAFTVVYNESRVETSGQHEFANPVAIPPVVEPRRGADGRDHVDLRLQTGTTEFLRGKQTRTWGVNGSYLGPTIRVRKGQHVSIHVTNDLPESSSLHWHGMRLPAVMDGGPYQEIEPGETWNPHWEVKQPAATLWYHPHPHGRTAEHVYRGVSGMLLVDDDISDALELPDDYGVDDIPLIIQDKAFTDDGQLDFNGRGMGPGSTGILGDTVLVNGTHDPHLEVTRTVTRLRVLNGSPARIYDLGFDDDRPFAVIASDSGLLPAPVERTRLRLSPGERVELLVTMEPGETSILRSHPTDLGGGFPADRFAGADDTLDILQLRAKTTLEPNPAAPRTLSAEEPLTAPADARVRRFELSGTAFINGESMDMGRIDEVVAAGATEIWEVRGAGLPHNFHIHDVAFRILTIDGREPPAWQAGRKDTVFIPAGSTVRLVVRFGTDVDPATPYMYHCHLLYHEDSGMMGQFVIVEPGQESSTPRRLDTGGVHDGRGGHGAGHDGHG
ncbi:putative multicopper oxidase [Saccharomonospora cyanea NA-134]|uniref:Putative multicopper oxidase n=1 Tax=Saccharomonospora cyanea NA-134 TaxID=882082 RepID=H5XCH7_9PSEU|nr:putative multicopper oxidase [Saccharomonospora cyanea NA-134]